MGRAGECGDEREREIAPGIYIVGTYMYKELKESVLPSSQPKKLLLLFHAFTARSSGSSFAFSSQLLVLIFLPSKNPDLLFFTRSDLADLKKKTLPNGKKKIRKRDFVCNKVETDRRKEEDSAF